MGEYADDYYRRDVLHRYGFDPGSMYAEEKPEEKPKKTCPKCGKHLKTEQGVINHLRDYHHINPKLKLTE